VWPRAEVVVPSRIVDWLDAIERVRSDVRAREARELSLLRPRTFSEKMQWRKLFDLDPRYAILCDKLAVRDFIAERVGGDVLVPLLWVGDDADAVPFDTLDPPYVIKSTHASGHVLRVRRREEVDVGTARILFKSWLHECYGSRYIEPGYVPVPHHLIAERMLSDADGNPPFERKLFLFDGRVKFTQTIRREQGRPAHRAFHDRDWRALRWYRKTPNRPETCPRPARYDQMVALAERVGKDFDHVRVDFYDLHDRIYMGEMTLYSWGGAANWTPEETDVVVGAYWPLKWPMWRAVNAVLWRRREIPRIKTSPGHGAARP
jgi:hypothetical protein